MPMDDWIHKYPRVQALLQRGDETLDYLPDADPDEASGNTPHGVADEDLPEDVITATDVYQQVENIILYTPSVTYARMVAYLAREYSMTEEELLAWLPRLPSIYRIYHRTIRRDLEAQLPGLQAAYKA